MLRVPPQGQEPRATAEGGGASPPRSATGELLPLGFRPPVPLLGLGEQRSDDGLDHFTHSLLEGMARLTVRFDRRPRIEASRFLGCHDPSAMTRRYRMASRARFIAGVSPPARR